MPSFCPLLHDITWCEYNRFPTCTHHWQTSRGGEKMTPAWKQRQEDLLHDCIVFPDVFNPMVDRLRDFVVPYQHALETEAGQRNMHLYVQGLLSYLPGKNAEDIATFVDIQRQVMQE